MNTIIHLPKFSFTFVRTMVTLVVFQTLLLNLQAQDPCSNGTTFSKTFAQGENVNSATSFLNTRIKVPANTTVNFNANVTMTGCTLVIGSNSVIRVQNSTLSLTGNGTRTLVTGCTNMWSSIELNSGARINLSNSDIRHGQTAFNFKTGSNPGASSVVGCNFDANVLCFKGSNFSTFIGVFNGNKMTGRLSANNVINMLPPLSLAFSIPKAIDISNVSGTLGSDAVGVMLNTVSGMSIGISQISGSMVLNNFTFKENESLQSIGIDVSSSGTLKLSKSCSFTGTSNSSIGVKCTATSTVVTSSTFKDYQSGIKLDKSYASLWGDCLFSGNVSGIDASKSTIFAFPATVTVNKNIFKNNKNGLLLDQAIILISGCSIYDNKIGINAVSSDLNVSPSSFPGFPASIANTFTNNKTAIFSKSSRKIVVRGNTFSDQIDLDIDINSSTDPAYNVEISNKNTFALNSPKKGSIYLERAISSDAILTRTLIKDNEFNFPETATKVLTNNIRFIDVFSTPGTIDKVEISSNKITCKYGNGPTSTSFARTIDGIYILGSGTSDGFKISGNVINFEKEAPAPNSKVEGVGIGVTMVSGLNNTVDNGNIITSTYFSESVNARESWLRCGIHIYGSPNVTVCSNQIDKLNHMYHFKGNCTNIDFANNLVLNGRFGFLNWGILPSRNHRRNKWEGSYTNFGAFNDLDEGATYSDYWKVDNTPTNGIASYLPPQPSSIFKYDEYYDDSLNTNLCPGVFLGSEVKPPIKRLTKELTNGTYSTASNANRWDIERNLLENMQKFQTEYVNDAISVAYYNSKLNTVIWQIANAENLLSNTSSTSSVNQQQITDIYLKISILKDSLMSMQKKQIANPLLIPTLATMQLEVVKQLNEKTNQIDSIGTLITNSRLTSILGAQTYLDGLIGTNVLERNYIIMLKLLAKRLKGEDWLNKDSIDLRSVAYSCSFDGGIAVILARELLPKEEYSIFPRELTDPYCVKSRSNDIETDQSVLTKMSLYPNPAKDNLIIGFTSKFSGTISIFNTSGIQVKSIKVKESPEIEIVINDLINGVYVIKSENSNHEIDLNKFIVIR
jgi:hypothetical protein